MISSVDIDYHGSLDNIDKTAIRKEEKNVFIQSFLAFFLCMCVTLASMCIFI